MPQVVIKKYNVTLQNPTTGEETTTIMTEEVGGLSIERAMSDVWNELGLKIIGKELLETIEEVKVSPDEDGAVPDQSPKAIQRRVVQNPNQQMYRNPQAPMPQQGMGVPQQIPINIPEKIVQHGDVRLKLAGDKVFVEEWVEKDYKIDERHVYKIISEEGVIITSKVTILHKEWVEMKEEKTEEPKPEPEEVKKVEPPSTTTNSVTINENEDMFKNMVDELILEDN